MASVALGLGSNLGDREGYLRSALALLAQAGIAVMRLSPLYETEPWGVVEQPRFINAACLAETTLPPESLLDTLKAIEQQLGRVPTVRWGPRTIDLDILLYDQLRLQTPRLTIPHPGMLQRASVLVPLADIAPQVVHPISGLTITQHRAQLGEPGGIAPFPPGLGPAPAQG